MNKKKKEILQRCKYLFVNDKPLDKMIEEEIVRLLNSGYIDYESYDFKENGYQLMKLINYCVMKRIADSFKPINTEFMKKYKSLIKNY